MPQQVLIIKLMHLQALKEAGNKTGLIWQHQLLQYPGVSTPVASAIFSKYPSPSHLLKAGYKFKLYFDFYYYFIGLW